LVGDGELAGKVDAELLDHVPAHFRNRDLEHDLIASAYGDSVHHLDAIADQPCCKIISLLRLRLTGRAARKHYAVADPFDVNVGTRNRLFDCVAHAIEIAFYCDVEPGDLPAVGIEEENVGLPDGDPDDVHPPRGTNHRIGDLGIGNKYILDVSRQIDRNRFANSERNKTGRRFARGDSDDGSLCCCFGRHCLPDRCKID
jgi:hypothetical protein